VLAGRLSHVLWIGGGACGGKTTMAGLLAAKHGMVHYNCDEQAAQYREWANPADHPAILKPFLGWEWYFGRSGAELASWLSEVLREQFPMTLVDLLRLGSRQPVVCEGIFPADVLRRIAPPGRTAFIYPEPELLREQYFAREDKQDMLRLIDQLSDPSRFRQNVLDCAMPSPVEIASAEALGIKILYRKRGSDPAEMLAQLEAHFGLPTQTNGADCGR